MFTSFHIDIFRFNRLIRALQNRELLECAQKNPKLFFADYGINLWDNIHYDILVDDEHTIYFVLPAASEFTLSPEVMAHIIASKRVASTLSTWLTYSSISSFGECLSTFSTVGTFSTAADLSFHWQKSP